MGDTSVYEHLQTLRRRYKVKKREAPPAQSTCSSGALRSVGCFGCANSRLLSVITQKQMCAKYRTLPSRPSCPVCTICRKHGFSLFYPLLHGTVFWNEDDAKNNDLLVKKKVNLLERSIIQIIFLIAFMCKMGAVLFDTVIFQQIYPIPLYFSKYTLNPPSWRRLFAIITGEMYR